TFVLGLAAQVLYRFLRKGWRAGLLEVEACTIGLGLGPLVLRSGWRGLRQLGGTFHRTPKAGRSVGGVSVESVAEIALGLIALASAAYAASVGVWMCVPLPLCAGLGLVFVGAATIRPGLGASRSGSRGPLRPYRAAPEAVVAASGVADVS